MQPVLRVSETKARGRREKKKERETMRKEITRKEMREIRREKAEKGEEGRRF